MPSNTDATRRYNERQRKERQFIRVSVWVPASMRGEIVKLANKLRQSVDPDRSKTP